MSKTITIEIPKDLSEISLKEYQKYIKVVNYNDREKPTQDELDFANLKMLEYFCGITMKEAYELPLSDFSHILNHLTKIFKEDTPLQRTFTMKDPNGVERKFGVMPKIDDMTLGEFIDLEKYVQSWETMHKAMAVLYRPITFEKGNLYLIEDYEGSDKYSSVMQDAPLNVPLGASVFFYHLGTELLNHIVHSLNNHLKNKEVEEVFQKNGVGINQFMELLKATSQNLTKLQNFPYFNV